MLHILWMILKIILITLGVLLGLVLLLLLLVLFCPIRYRASASSHEEEICGKARVSWLLSAVSATAAYRDGRRSVSIRILGIPLETLKKLPGKFRRQRKKAPDRAGQPDREAPEKDLPAASSQNRDTGLQSKSADSRPAEPAGEPESIPESPLAGEGETISPGSRIAALWRRICRLVRGIWSKILRVFRLLVGIPGRICRFFHRMTLTITGFYGKIDRWKTFFQDERTIAGIRLGWEEIKKLLGHISPRKIAGNLVIGLDNPAATGQVLALIGATVPVHKNRVAVEPVFDRKVLEADVRMRGRVYLFYVLIRGMKLYFDKNIKYIMKEFNKEG